MKDAEEPVRTFETAVAAASVDERPQLVETPKGRLALLRRDDEIIAIDAWCPHIDGPLWEGSAVHGEIGCPWHGWRYSLATGACTWAPDGDAEEAAETEIRILSTKIVDGLVSIEFPGSDALE